MNINPVARALDGIRVGPPVVVENLVMFPLVARPAAKPALDYLTLDEALAQGETAITEVSEHGSVPELLVINRGAKPALIVDGEELVGAKQNRVVNLTILVAARSTVTIPVSCVEAGRWRARSSGFASAPRAQYAAGRALRMSQVSRSMVDRGERMSDQAAVWADIAEKSERMHAESPTAAMAQIFTSHAASVDRFVEAFEPIDGQCGALFAIDDRIVGFDLFDAPATLRKLLPKLVRSYAIDAIDPAGSGHANGYRRGRGVRLDKRSGGTEPLLVPAFLAAVGAAPQQRATGVGLGEDVRLAANGLLGAALVVDDQVVHLSGFTA